ncbi:uncharacterized protein LOC134189691 [Corticium candelabrum]|uniref:uncharacterized protein LOC134189691 n=1 Tax=Corticium candelabrum TaxID=121492 RepID=UPI002E254BDF|nr:uncharacterized protein LOC134189691 [Corticium candelabrum]
MYVFDVRAVALCFVLATIIQWNCVTVQSESVCPQRTDNKAVMVGTLPQTCDASNGGDLYYSPSTNRLTLCDGSSWIHFGMSVKSELGSYDNPIVSCSVLRGKTSTAQSGTYWLKPPTSKHSKPFQIYCDFDLRPNGCALVWKHSYYQVTPNNNTRTFSTFNKPCIDLSDGWCNVANKNTIEGSEQVTAAYHHGTVVYAYRGDRNPQLGKASQWRGAILNNPIKITDHCTRNNGVAPEPEVGGHAIPGITFDKANPGEYTLNCDTDRYAWSPPKDCRWLNCNLPAHISTTTSLTQMTVAIYLC